MERITSVQTIKHADGNSHEQMYCFGHLWGPAFFKKGTRDYEEYLAIVKRLAEYEDLEEQGKLPKLPCAVGDTVYRINTGKKEPIIPMLVIGAAIRNENELVIQTKDIKDDGHNLYSKNSIGKTVFLTKEEAKIMLKKLRETEKNE